MTEAQVLLAYHLKELGVLDVVFEHRFLADRKFRFDLYSDSLKMGFEVNGHFAGKHGSGWSNDAEKMNLAQLNGYRVLVFTNREVLKGKAKEFLAEWIGAKHD